MATPSSSSSAAFAVVGESPTTTSIVSRPSSAATATTTTTTSTSVQLKVVIRLKSVGNAPILKQPFFKISTTQRFQTVINFLRKELGIKVGDGLFLYINSSFAPAPDELVGNLFSCFGVEGSLVVNYSLNAAWGIGISVGCPFYSHAASPRFGQFAVNPNGARWIADVVGDNPFNIISVLGPKRAGKSTFMSSLAGNINTFQASDDMDESFTMGSHCACNLPTLADFAASNTQQVAVGGGVSVGFLDQEGLDDQNKADYLQRLSIPGLIASKSVFYFSTVTDATKIRADLRIITGYADKLLSGHSSSALSFGHLHIIIADRQTRSAKKRKEAQEKFSESLFGTGIKDQNLLETAKKIISAFESIRVWNLPNLGTSLTDDNNDYQDPTSSNYEETVQAIKSVLLDQLTTPRVILDQKLTGTNFAAMIGSVVETVNAGDPIRMESIEEILEPTSVKLERLRTRFIEMDKTEMVGFFKEQLNTVEEDVISATKAEAARQRFCSAIESKIPFLKTDSRENECNDFKVDSARRWKTSAATHNKKISNPEYEVITKYLDSHFEEEDKKTILTNMDVSSFPKLKALVGSPPEKRAELSSKLSENGRKTFDKEMTLGNVKKLKNNSEEHKKFLETAKAVTEIQNSLQPFLQKAETLRSELDTIVAKGETEIRQSTRAKVEESIKELALGNKEFASLSSASFRRDVNGYREDFEKLVRWASDKHQTLNDFEKVEEPIETIIQGSRIGYGVLLGEKDGIRSTDTPMITFDDYELMRDRVSSIDQVQFDYERATLMGRLATIIETGGLSMAAAVKASGVGFIGSGIGAFSASASFSMASARHEAVSNEAKNEEFAIGQELCYSFPKRIVEVQIENVRLVDGALSKIKEMYQQILAIGGDGTGNGAKADAIKPLVEKFLLEYGSHVYLSATLGGVLIRQAEMQVKDVTHLYDYKQALSNQLQSSASLSGAYFGQSGFGSMGGGGAGRSNQDSSTGNVANSQQHSASTYLRTKLIGGQDTKDSLDLWKLSLGFSSNLNVIDRKKVKAVWEIIQARHESDFENSATLKTLCSLMQQVYFELQYPTLFSGRETSSAVDEATIIAEFEKKKVQLDQKAFMDKLDEKDFEREAVRQLREVDSYERIHSFLKDGEIKSISLVCLGVVKQECNANGIAAAKRKNIDCIRGQVLELAQTLKRRLVDHNEQASYEATMKAARDNHSKEWPAHIVVRNKLDHRLSFREQSQHMGELRHVPVSIEAKTSGWFRSIECPHLHWTEASVKFNVVGSANNDVIEVYWHNGRQRSECLGLPAGYTCSVAFDYHRKFITYTIDRAVN